MRRPGSSRCSPDNPSWPPWPPRRLPGARLLPVRRPRSPSRSRSTTRTSEPESTPWPLSPAPDPVRGSLVPCARRSPRPVPMGVCQGIAREARTLALRWSSGTMSACRLSHSHRQPVWPGTDTGRRSRPAQAREEQCRRCPQLAWVPGRRCYRCLLGGCCEDWRDRLRLGSANACPLGRWAGLTSI